MYKPEDARNEDDLYNYPGIIKDLYVSMQCKNGPKAMQKRPRIYYHLIHQKITPE